MNYQPDKEHQYSEFYTQKVSRYFSLPITKGFLALGWSANSVTYLMWVTGILAGICLLFSDWEVRILGCFLMFMINVLDTSDGEIARHLGTCTPFGALLDKIVHFTTNQIIYSSLFIGFYLYDGFFLWLIIAVSLNLVTTSDEILKELFVRHSNINTSDSKKMKLTLSYSKTSLLQKILHVIFGSTGFYHLFIIFVIFDLLFSGYLIHKFLFEGIYVLSFFIVNTAKLVMRYQLIKKKIEVK